ncbi:hypothetical protein ACFE04_031514 [Oxalis oulophora]
MAMESSMRMVEGSESRNWSPAKDVSNYGSPLKNMAAEELGLILKGQRFNRDDTGMIPNRSGSAPPSMEGSFEAIGKLLAQQNTGLNLNLENLTAAMENCKTEEQLRSDPAYLAYYCSNVNLNPRLPPPLMSRENRRLIRHIGGIANWKPSDDTDNGILQLSRNSLSTHNEEPDNDIVAETLENWADEGDSFTGEQNISYLSGRHKSLVDLIQEDFPRTPSPVFESRSSSHATTDEPIESDIHAASVDVSSISFSDKTELNMGPTNVQGDVSISLPPNGNGNGNGSGSGSGSSQTQEKNDTRTKKAEMEDERRDVSENESGGRNKYRDPQSYTKSVPQGTRYQVQGAQSPVTSQFMRNPISEMENLSHSHHRPYVTDFRATLPSSGLTSPYYAAPTPYMSSGNPYFPNYSPPGLYAPQYGIGGAYAPLGSSVHPSFIAGYPQSAMHVPLDTNLGPGLGFDIQNVASSSGDNNFHVNNMQHLGKFYRPHGLVLQPPFIDPLQSSYLQQNFGDAYNSSVSHSRLAAGGSHVDAFTPTGGNIGIPSPKKTGIITGGNYYGVAPDLGVNVMTQFGGSPLGSPVLPSSPILGMSYQGQRNETRFPLSPVQKLAPYVGWPGPRAVNIIDDSKRHSFLEELKCSSSRKFELSDIAGRIVEFSVDQHGSRFIQQKLEQCNMEDKASVFIEVVPHASKLITDVFGNYVIQKFFEHGSPEQRRELADQLVGHMLPLCLQMYGCRVIQKALEVIELDQKIKLVSELDGHVMKCVRDQNGNHVIQKCIECLPAEKIGFIMSAFQGQIATLSTHPYGCRVIQRILEHGSDELQCQCIVDEILEYACVLAEDQYGNYVIQSVHVRVMQNGLLCGPVFDLPFINNLHVLERGKPHERSQIINNLTGKIVQMSQHKYASNVIEKCLRFGDALQRERLIDEILGHSDGNDILLTMMKDQFANYVVQKIFETGTDRQQEILLNNIRDNLHALKKYTYGKHIVLRYEQLVGEETEAAET